jgi:hypothetical protein
MADEVFWGCGPGHNGVFWYREERIAELSMRDLVKRCKMDTIKVSLRTPGVVLVPRHWNGRSEGLG